MSSDTSITLAERHAAPTARLLSLDTYRGLVMVAMASAGFGIPVVAAQHPVSPWPQIAWCFTHVPWEGCSPWDLVHPAFMFMCGVALAFSYAARTAQGESWRATFRHVIVRAVALVVMGVCLASIRAGFIDFLFTNVLAQIGLAYALAFLFCGCRLRTQVLGGAAILAAYWLAFALYPAPRPGPGFDYAAYNLAGDWNLMSGLAAHWNRNLNFGTWFDQWLLNLFPRPEPFRFNLGSYQTLNFVPGIVTMLIGLMTGELLRSSRSSRAKLGIMVAVGGALIAAGLLAGWTVCPIVKRIWTPSFTLYSGGWVMWMLAAAYAVIDVAGLRRWSRPLVPIGMNPLLMYLMSFVASDGIWNMIQAHFCRPLRSPVAQAALCGIWGPAGFDPRYTPIVETTTVLVFFWFVCLWFYRQKIFVRL